MNSSSENNDLNRKVDKNIGQGLKPGSTLPEDLFTSKFLWWSIGVFATISALACFIVPNDFLSRISTLFAVLSSVFTFLSCYIIYNALNVQSNQMDVQREDHKLFQNSIEIEKTKQQHEISSRFFLKTLSQLQELINQHKTKSLDNGMTAEKDAVDLIKEQFSIAKINEIMSRDRKGANMNFSDGSFKLEFTLRVLFNQRTFIESKNPFTFNEILESTCAAYYRIPEEFRNTYMLEVLYVIRQIDSLIYFSILRASSLANLENFVVFAKETHILSSLKEIEKIHPVLWFGMSYKYFDQNIELGRFYKFKPCMDKFNAPAIKEDIDDIPF